MGLAVEERTRGELKATAAERTAKASGKIRDLLSLVPLGALTLLFFWRIWTPKVADRGSFPAGDFFEQFYPFAVHRARELLSGDLPLWYPWAFSGAPFQADIQSAVFYPLSWPATLIFGPRGYPVIALELEAIGHIFLAAAFTYLLGRTLFGHRFAALLAAVTCAFGGYLTSYPMQQLSILEVHTWLPLVILALHRATEADVNGLGRLRLGLLAGGVLALGILAGHPQAALYLIYGGSAYFLVRAWWLLREAGRFGKGPRAESLVRSRAGSLPGWLGEPLARPLARSLAGAFALFLILGLGLSAVQWIPTYDFMRITARSAIDYDFARWGFPLRDIFQFVLPGSVSLMSPLYVGILPLALALTAILVARARETAFWGVFTAVALLISFGGHTFLYSALYLTAPGFGTFRDHERAAVLVSFGLAVLAGYGADRLIRAEPGAAWLSRLRRGLLWGALGAAAFYLLAYLANRIAPGRADDLLDRTAFLILLCLLAAALLFARQNRWPAGALALAALALVVLDVFTANWLVNFEKVLPGDRFPDRPITRYLQSRRDQGRAFNEHRLFLNYGAVYQIEDANGASPLINARYKRLLEHEPKERFWDLLNVRYLLTWRADYGGGPKLLSDKLPKGEEMHLFERPSALPRAWVVHHQEVIADDEAAFARLVSPDFDPRSAAILPAAPDFALGRDGAPGAPVSGPSTGSAEIAHKSTSSLTVRVSSPEPGLLVLAEVYTPGWQATIDGQPVEVLRADYTLRAVPVPAGDHEVRLRYDPPSFKVGLATSGLFLLLALAGLAVLHRRARTREVRGR